MLIPSWSKAQKEAFRTHHPTKYPIKQVKHNYPKANVKEFADLIFAADCPEYKGLVTIVRRPKGTSTMETVASVPAEEAGEWLSRMHVSANADYYKRGRLCEEHGEGYDSGKRGNENIYGMPADRPGYRQLHHNRTADNDSRAEGKCGTDAGGKAHHCFLLSASNGLLSRGPR